MVRLLVVLSALSSFVSGSEIEQVRDNILMIEGIDKIGRTELISLLSERGYQLEEMAPLYFSARESLNSVNGDLDSARKDITEALDMCGMNYYAPGSFCVSRTFSDKMVLQREKPIRVWGTGRKGDSVEAVLTRVDPFLNESGKTIVDTLGRWEIELPAIGETEGACDLFVGVIDTSSSVAYSDSSVFDSILIGDVWVCAGQSNMAVPVKESSDAANVLADAENHPNIRLYRPMPCLSDTQICNLHGIWQVCCSTTVKNFSAVGFNFGRYLQDSLNVPIGIVQLATGNTILSQWIAFEHLAANGPEYLAERKLSADSLRIDDPRVDRFRQELSAYHRLIMDTLLEPIQSPIQRLAGRSFKDAELPQLFSDISPGAVSKDAVVWFARIIPGDLRNDLPADCYSLEIPTVFDFDAVYVNSNRIGHIDTTESRERSRRRYTFAPSILTGKDTAFIHLINARWEGGIANVGLPLRIVGGTVETSGDTTWASKPNIDLSGTWKYTVTANLNGQHPLRREPLLMRDTALSSTELPIPSLLYNSFIAPLTRFQLTGIVWYQGEANVCRGYQYRHLLPALMENWRSEWDQELPFLIIQVSTPGTQSEGYESSSWAELRESQYLTANSDSLTSLVVTFDIGDSTIHPRNKKDVGIRAGHCARALVYDHTVVFEGPVYKRFRSVQNSFELIFENTAGGLETSDGESVVRGFALAEADSVFREVEGEIVGDDRVRLKTSEVTPPILSPLYLRYGWADSPDANLVNGHGLPPSPFRTDRHPVTTQGKKYPLGGCR